jgi:hypothetical protein
VEGIGGPAWAGAIFENAGGIGFGYPAGGVFSEGFTDRLDGVAYEKGFVFSAAFLANNAIAMPGGRMIKDSMPWRDRSTATATRSIFCLNPTGAVSVFVPFFHLSSPERPADWTAGLISNLIFLRQ